MNQYGVVAMGLMVPIVYDGNGCQLRDMEIIMSSRLLVHDHTWPFQVSENAYNNN